MIRISLLGAVLSAAPVFAFAECENRPGAQENCVRALACIGAQGQYFEGQSQGWDQGTLVGQILGGYGGPVSCEGVWDSHGPMGTGIAQLTCDDGRTADVIYYTQDSRTGTVIGTGKDSEGRRIRAWTGENVLEFLSDGGAPRLPCATGPIPLS